MSITEANLRIAIVHKTTLKNMLLALPVHRFDLIEDVFQFPAITTGIGPDRATNGTRNTRQKGQA